MPSPTGYLPPWPRKQNSTWKLSFPVGFPAIATGGTPGSSAGLSASSGSRFECGYNAGGLLHRYGNQPTQFAGRTGVSQGEGLSVPKSKNPGEARVNWSPSRATMCLLKAASPRTTARGGWACSSPPFSRGGCAGDKMCQSHSFPCSEAPFMSLFTVDKTGRPQDLDALRHSSQQGCLYPSNKRTPRGSNLASKSPQLSPT